MPLDHHVLILRLLVACVLGAAIGYERDRHRRAAGLRTHLLVSLAAAMFMVVSTQFAHLQGYRDEEIVDFDPSRIASQVVAGAGFLVGGAILRSGPTVRGLTTAAALWLATAIGMAAGAGMFVEAGAVTAFGLIALWVMRPIEGKGRMRVLGRISVVSTSAPTLAELKRTIEATGAFVLRHDYRVHQDDDPRVEASFAIRHHPEFDTDLVVREVQKHSGIRSVRIERSD
jgi:putative Mg2+ transporter-C (MgtC) family protein